MFDDDVHASVVRALDATDAEHAGAIEGARCAVCGADPGYDCAYGAYAGRPAGQHFPGRAHTRRVRAYLASILVDTKSDP